VLFCTSLYSKPNILSLPLKVKFTSPYIQIFMVRIWTLNSQIFWHPSGFYNKNQMQRKELLFVLFSMCFIRDAHHHIELRTTRNAMKMSECEWNVYLYFIFIWIKPRRVSKNWLFQVKILTIKFIDTAIQIDLWKAMRYFTVVLYSFVKFHWMCALNKFVQNIYLSSWKQ